MRIILQRVSEASVTIEEKIESKIKKGLLLLVGIEDADTQDDIEWLCRKIINMRIFNDEKGTMNLSVKDIDGDILVISQFTLHANTKKGNRPSFIKAAKPNVAIPLYKSFLATLKQQFKKEIYAGIFGADMQVSLINDGPVTIFIDSKQKKL